MGVPLPMEFQDKILKCVDCGTDFVFTAGEQLFFRDKQFKNEPKRCKNCKGKRVAVLGPWVLPWALLYEDRNAHELFPVWQGDHSSVPSDPRTAGLCRDVSSKGGKSPAPEATY